MTILYKKAANMIQVGKDAFMHEEHFRMVCEHLLNEIQLQYWGKKVADCSDDEYENGLQIYLESRQ